MSSRVIRDPRSPEFRRLFTDLQQSWFRLETLQRYDATNEREDFAAFLRGEPISIEPGPWQAMIRAHVAAGRELARVHVVEEPLSDYIRYELAAYVPNVAAGEDVRLIPVPEGTWPASVPRHDFWLFDDEQLWLMDYSPTGALEAVRLVDDPLAVAEHRRWRDTAIASSMPLDSYQAVRQLA